MFALEFACLDKLRKDVIERASDMSLIETERSAEAEYFRRLFLIDNVLGSKNVEIVTGILPQYVFGDRKVLKTLKKILKKKGEVTMIAGPDIVTNEKPPKIAELLKYPNFSFYYTRVPFELHFALTEDELYFEEPHLDFQAVRKGYCLKGARDLPSFLRKEIAKVKEQNPRLESFNQIPLENCLTELEYANAVNRMYYERFIGQKVDEETARSAWRAHLFYLNNCEKRKAA